MDPCRAIPGAVRAPVTHPRLLDAHGTNAGLNVAFGQMTMAHHPRPAIVKALASMGVNKYRDLSLNRVRKQALRSAPKNLGQKIGKRPWLNQWRNCRIRHGVSFLSRNSWMLESHPRYAA
jgi:hypothetical protein